MGLPPVGRRFAGPLLVERVHVRFEPLLDRVAGRDGVDVELRVTPRAEPLPELEVPVGVRRPVLGVDLAVLGLVLADPDAGVVLPVVRQRAELVAAVARDDAALVAADGVEVVVDGDEDGVVPLDPLFEQPAGDLEPLAVLRVGEDVVPQFLSAERALDELCHLPFVGLARHQNPLPPRSQNTWNPASNSSDMSKASRYIPATTSATSPSCTRSRSAS
jgi:hypothetical protein